MIYSKNTLKQKISLALSSRKIKHQIYPTMLSSEFGDLIFSDKHVSLRHPGKTGASAVFKYSEQPSISHILTLLTNPKSAPGSSLAQGPTESSTPWPLYGGALLIGLSISSLAVSQIDLSAPESRSSESPKRFAAFRAKDFDETKLAVDDGLIKAIQNRPQLHEIESAMTRFEASKNQNMRIQYKFAQDTWLKDNLESISALTKHTIIYATKTDLKIQHQILEVGRGSDLAKKVFSAISPNFDGELILLQCRNTSIITDQRELSSLCG